MGRAKDEEYPALVVVGTISGDFESAILDVKHDRDYVVPKLQARGTDEYNILAARAESGMRLIIESGRSNLLAQPDETSLLSTYSKLKEIHSKAYNWTAPDVDVFPPGSQRTSRRMRAHVRRWINEWDLKRLYPDADIQIEEQDLQPSYSEDKDLEKEVEEDSGTEFTGTEQGQQLA